MEKSWNDDNVVEFLLLHRAILLKWHDFIYKVKLWTVYIFNNGTTSR